MNVYEQVRSGGNAAATSGFVGSPSSVWRIGAGRITMEEFESWQLGPDVTKPCAKSPAWPARERRRRAR